MIAKIIRWKALSNSFFDKVGTGDWSVSRGGYGGPQADDGEGQTGQDMRSSQIINIRYGAYVPVRVIPI